MNIQVVKVKAEENVCDDRLRRVSLREKTCRKPCQAYTALLLKMTSMLRQSKDHGRTQMQVRDSGEAP